MYRRQASQSVLSGVPSGPFTGGLREIDSRKLAAGTRERLARALRGGGEPSFIAFDPASSSRKALVRSLLGMALAAATITIVFRIGYGSPLHPWARQPLVALLLYLAAGMLASVSITSILRRRSGAELPPGRYLFPLDLVDVGLPDANGRQVLEVRSLGDARDARIEGSHLVVHFDGAVTARLRVDDGERALQRLEEAQALIEKLTYAKVLDEALAHDLFFDHRIDGSWSSVAPDTATPPSKHRALALGLGAAITAGSFFARRELGEEALFAAAYRWKTPEAFDVYLAQGGRYRERAELRRQRLIVEREAKAYDERLNASREADRRPSVEAMTPAACIDALRAQSSPAHPEVPRVLAEIANDTHHVIPFVFTRKLPSEAPRDLVPDLDARERVTAWAFERVFSDVCPANILRFERADLPNKSGPLLHVAYEVTWSGKNYEALDVQGFRVVFDVTFRGPDATSNTFRLTMPPPVEPPTTLRERSIFTLPSHLDRTDRMYAAMTTRAFDRLYDEIYGLLFAGDPRVPLRDPRPAPLGE